MTDRIPLDDMTSDQLDHLYADRDRTKAALTDMTRDRDRQTWYVAENDRKRKVQRDRANTAEATLARVRALRDDLRGITGARYIADALDTILDGEQAPAEPVPCPACRRADQAGLAPGELHPECATEQPS